MMVTKTQKIRAAAVLDKLFSLDDPSPLDPEDQALLQRRCAEEATRLQDFLTRPLTKKARKEISDFEPYFSKASGLPVVAIGLSRSLAPFMGHSLTTYGAGKVQSYSRRQKGKIYERV